MSLMSLALQERGRADREVDRVAKARAKYLSDPGKVDKWVSSVMRTNVPDDARIQTTKHPTKTAAVDAAFSSDDPRRGLGEEIKGVFNKVLASDKYKDADPDKLLAAVTAVGLERRRLATYDYTRKQQGALLGGQKVKPMAGYDDWIAQQRAAEEAGQTDENSVGFFKDAPRNAALGAGFAAAGQGIARTEAGQAIVKTVAKPLAKAAGTFGIRAFSRMAATGLEAAPNPWAKIAGAALLAIPEFYAFEKASEVVERSEWGQANKDSAKVLAAELLTGGVAAGATGSILRRGGKAALKKALEADKVSMAAKQQLAKFPGAEAVINAHEAAVKKTATEKALQVLVDDETVINDSVVKAAEESAAKAQRDAVLKDAGVELDSLAKNSVTARRGLTAAERKTAAKEAARSAAALENISAAEGVSFPELRVFKAEQTLAGHNGAIKTLEKKIAKAVKAGDYKAVSALDEELSTVRSKADAIRKEFGAGVHDEAEVFFGQKIKSLDEAIGNATDETTKKALIAERGKVQKALDKEIATSLNNVSDEGVARVEEKIAQGEAPLAAVKKVERGEAVVAKQEKAVPAVEIEKAAVAQQVQDETKTAVLEDIKKAIEPTIKKGSIKAPAPTAEELAYAGPQGLGIKGYKKMTRPQLLDAIERYEANIDKVTKKLKPRREAAKARSVLNATTTEDGFDVALKSPVKFDSKNLPPFAKLKTGKITEAEYLEAMKDPDVRRAEYDLFAEGPEHILADRQKTLSRLTVDAEQVSIAQSEAKAMDKEITEAKKLAKLDEIEEPDFEELAALEKELTGVEPKKPADWVPGREDENLLQRYLDIAEGNVEADAAQANVDAVVEKSADPIKTAKHVKAVEAESNAFDEAVVETANAKQGKVIRRRPKSTFKTILALAGPTAAAMILAEPDNDADASMASSIAAGFVRMAEKEAGVALKDKTATMLKGMLEHIKPPVVADGQKALPGKMGSLSTIPSKKVNFQTKRLPFFQDLWRSPHWVAEFYYKGLHNPMVEIASKMTAAINDTAAARSVYKNILMDVKGANPLQNKIAREEAIAALRPVQEKYQKPFALLGHAKGMVKELEKRIVSNEKKAAKGVGDFAAENEQLSKELSKFRGIVTDNEAALAGHQADWEAAVKPLAAKHASTRIALAVENDAAFSQMPWLRGMLTAEETEAVAHLKGMMQEIGGRVENAGGRAIKDAPYIHHAIHPAHDFAAIKEALADVAVDVQGSPIYSKFHSRMLGSKQMVPEVEYIMEKYLPDINKRIHMTEFWKKGGWEKHANEVSKHNEALAVFWNTVRDGFKPHESTFMNKVAKHYTSFEVMRLLAGSASVPFKHAVKVSASLAQFPLTTSVRTVPKAVKAAIKIGVNRAYNDSWMLKKLGAKVTLTEQEQLIDSLTKQGTYIESIADLNIGDIPKRGVMAVINKINEVGSIPVRGIELFDRAVSTIGGMEVAAKNGMTPQQGIDAVMKTILQSNFLGANQNPAWLRNPKIRAMMMFQGTPFKIAERRLEVAMAAKRSVTSAMKETYRQLQNIKADVREGETLFKAELIKDALLSEKDQFGTAYSKIFMKEALGLGAFVGLGYQANLDLSSAAFHVPLVRFEKTGPTVAMNPVLQEAYRTSAYQDKDDFWLSQFFTNYFKGVGLSNTYTKAMRLSSGDIPARYVNADNPELAYLFAIPAKGSH